MLLLIASALALDADVFSMGATTWDPSAFTRLGTPDAGDPGDWDAGMVLDYADDPVSEMLPTGRAPVLDALATARLGFAYSFGGLRVDGALPIHAGADAGGTFAAAGDASVGAQIGLPGSSDLAVNTVLFFPTGAAARLVGGPPRLLAVARLGREIGRVGIIAVAGALCSLPEDVGETRAAVGPALGLGAGYRVNDALSAMIEVEAEGAWGVVSVPVEATLSTRMRLASGVSATVGAAAGLGAGVGASRWRAMVGIGFSSRAPDHSPAVPADGLALAGDLDDDSVTDAVDACPEQPETLDGFADEDGCPELDGDGDGVAFERDACPTEAIRPEQDPRYSDGCPRAVELAGDHLAITEAIFFKEGGAELLPSAGPVLLSISAVIQEHPEVGMFLIEGHASGDGPDGYNQRLSDARAYSVLQRLVQHGVDPRRLVSRGYGEARPIVRPEAPDASALNRRVEFRVINVEEVPDDGRQLVLPTDVQ